MPLSNHPNHSSIHKGNARRESPAHRGWFIGQFIDAAEGLRHSDDVEVKWGEHDPGDARTQASADNATTMILLIDGEFIVQFPENKTETVLANRGDYVIYGPGIPHTWIASERSLLVTVRWPSKR